MKIFHLLIIIFFIVIQQKKKRKILFFYSWCLCKTMKLFLFTPFLFSIHTNLKIRNHMNVQKEKKMRKKFVASWNVKSEFVIVIKFSGYMMSMMKMDDFFVANIFFFAPPIFVKQKRNIWTNLDAFFFNWNEKKKN